MMILDKKQTLHTLFNLGATLKDIRKIFFLQGIIMTILGTILGLIIGFVVVYIQQSLSLVMITASLPYPMAIHFENYAIVFLTISILGIIASRIAAMRISKSLLKAV
jgi:lipoprotein-releasing system permease protein